MLSNKLNLLSTIADRSSAGSYNLNFLSVLPDPDPVLRKRGEDARVLSDIEADDQVTAITLSRKNRVLNRQNYTFKPGHEQSEDPTEIASFVCKRLIKDLENLTMRDVISGIMEAPFWGMAVLEISWEVHNGWWHVKGLELKPNSWFAFNRENRLVFKGEKIGEAEALPEGKFILTRHYATYENPYGLRLLSRCLWPGPGHRAPRGRK